MSRCRMRGPEYAVLFDTPPASRHRVGPLDSPSTSTSDDTSADDALEEDPEEREYEIEHSAA